MATVSLRGRAADTALLEISGQVNPTAKPLALDIRARATDLALAPLSPYAGKYAGYAIERGKLSVDVAYKIDVDGKLAASHRVVLNQLTFGDRVESASATRLPVLLAVSLLKDRNGVIDINLPVSGSVSDPQFSVAGIVWKVILNLLGRDLTAPFSLLFGNSSSTDMSLVEFVPGTNRLAEAAQATLASVAQALLDRPALMMTVAGAADPAAEREALQRALLDERLLAEARLERLRAAAPAVAGSAASAASAAALPALPAPPALPASAGTPREPTPAEVETRLLARIAVSEDTARELALQRGLAVRDALIARSPPSDRLFLAAPRLRASGEDDKPWTPRVELTLSTR